jgi:hypothetical protein
MPRSQLSAYLSLGHEGTPFKQLEATAAHQEFGWTIRIEEAHPRV